MGCTSSHDLRVNPQGFGPAPRPISNVHQTGHFQQNGHANIAQHSQPQAANTNPQYQQPQPNQHYNQQYQQLQPNQHLHQSFPAQQYQQPQPNQHHQPLPINRGNISSVHPMPNQGAVSFVQPSPPQLPPIQRDIFSQAPLPPIQKAPLGALPSHKMNPTHNLIDEVTEKTDIRVWRIKVDRDILLRYVQLEVEICTLEYKNVLKAVKVKEEDLMHIQKRIAELENIYQASLQATAKEKADVDHLQEWSVKQFLEEKGQYVQAFSKEQEEYLEALNRQEIIKKELESARQTYDLESNEVIKLKSEAATITELYRQQDELLAGIFDGNYGSELEYQLESQLDTLLDRKQRVGMAKYKWQNARALLQHAVDQLGHAVKKWVELHSIMLENMPVRYLVATETRNSIVAAHQNFISAQRHLGSVQFPYCKPEELDTLLRAANNIYIDMQTPDRHAHALNCYQITHRRAWALLQWFDSVIENTIMKDMERSALNVLTKEKELRQERLRLIKEKVQEQMGDSVDLDVQKEIDELEKQTEAQGKMEGEGQIPGVVAVMSDDKLTTAQPEAKPDDSETDGPTSENEAMAHIDLAELAPPPNMDDLFGNIDELRKKHEKEMEEFEKTQQLNKDRIDQGLQEKLRARQSRRKRQTAQEQTSEAST